MPDHGTVVWALDSFKTDGRSLQPWLVVSGERRHSPDEESIAATFTTQSHYAGSFAVPGEARVRGDPGQESSVLPWTVATLKDGLAVVGRQGSVTNGSAEQITSATISYLGHSQASDPA
jgi:hypothetical protein